MKGPGKSFPGLFNIQENISAMKLNFFIYGLLFLTIISCSEAPQPTKSSRDKIEQKSIHNNKPGSSFSDSLKLDFPVAVFYSPDSLQLEKIKANTDPAIFDGSMHEYFYLMKNARADIRKYYHRLKIRDIKNVRYLLFIHTDKSADCIDLDTKKDACGLYVFDMKKAPLLVDMANVNTELGFYFPK